MGLRAWNRTRLIWFLNQDWPDRLAGAPDREQPVEARKLEGRVILRAAAFDSVDDHYDAKRRRIEGYAVDEDYARSYKALLYLMDEYMPQEYPFLDRAMKRWFLKESVAGAYVEIERFKRLSNPLADTIAELGEEWIERVLDELDRWKFRLFVRKDARAASRREAYDQAQKEEAALKKEWIRDKYVRYKEETNLSDSAIKERLRWDFAKRAKNEGERDTPISISTVNRALRGPLMGEREKKGA